MFQYDDDFTEEDLSKAVAVAQHNYKIKPGDLLSLQLYTNNGERIVDPNFEFLKDINVNNNLQQINPNYLVQENGQSKFPLIGQVTIENLTLLEAESKLQALYDSFYKDSYVVLNYLNKRVTVLGANGGMTIPLENQNTSLMEILALYGGLQLGSKAHNIRIIRGNYNNPEVFMVDLTTITGMKNTITDIEPGDVIYIEPWRRPLKETIRDASPFLSLASSILALTLVLQNVSK